MSAAGNLALIFSMASLGTGGGIADNVLTTDDLTQEVVDSSDSVPSGSAVTEAINNAIENIDVVGLIGGNISGGNADSFMDETDDETSTTNYYGFGTEDNIWYYLDEMPEVGDEGINIYDTSFNLLANDGICSLYTLVGKEYLRVDSTTLNLTICRWGDSHDVIDNA